MNTILTKVAAAALFAAYMITAASCSGDRAEAVRMLAEAEVLAETDPNTALTIIEKIDSLHIHFGGENHARLALVGTKARYRCFQAVKDDTLIHDAVRYFQKHGNDKELGEALMYQGAVLYEQERTKDALESYKDAERALGKTGSNMLLGLINTRIGEIYRLSLVNDPEETERLRKALHYFDMTDDIGRITQAHLSLARSLISTESYNEASTKNRADREK